MTYADLMPQVEGLSPQERILLIEAILRGLRDELSAAAGSNDVSRLKDIPPASAMRGIGKATGSAPTDQELKDDYASHLEQKYT